MEVRYWKTLKDKARSNLKQQSNFIYERKCDTCMSKQNTEGN